VAPDQEVRLPTDQARSPLRIAVVAPPWYPLPPGGYGGIEAMVYWLVEGLVARGHEVTLIGAGQSRTSGTFRRTYAEAPTDRMGQPMPEVMHALMASDHLDALDLDVVHDHSFVGPLATRCRRAPTVVTAHGPVTGELADYYRRIGRQTALVAISGAQRASGPGVRWAGTVPNAVPVAEYPFEVDKDDYCLFLGRMNPEKAPDLAIRAARAAGRRIVVAAKCSEPEERRYFDQRVRPLLGPDVEWFGEASTGEKKALLARASCLVFPIQWDEPFGLVMVEAMACGTPVVALRRGSVPDVVVDGVTGWVRDTPDELPEAINRVHLLDPKACRKHVRARFDLPGMAAGYEAVYRRRAGAQHAGPAQGRNRAG
jgi:glycosyltransferase involved in cell wall biosynthesis